MTRLGAGNFQLYRAKSLFRITQLKHKKGKPKAAKAALMKVIIGFLLIKQKLF